MNKPRKQRLSGVEISRIIQGRGFQVSYSTIKNIIRNWNETHRHREVYVLQDPPEGYRAEFDWGFVDLTLGNIVQKVSLAIFTLNFSQYRFGLLFLNQTSFDVIQAHIHFFNEIKAVPQVIVYDNATTIYDIRKKQYNQRFLLCATHYQFKPQVCNPASPHEKGSTEKSVSVVRKSAFSERVRFASLSDANDHLRECLKGLNNQRVHRRTEVPVLLLEEERPEMYPLPSLEFSNYELRNASINRYNLVEVYKNYYSVPDSFCSKSILVKIFADRIEMMENEDVIAVHIRKIGRGEYSLQTGHYLMTLGRKPGAIRHSKLLRSLDQEILKLLEMHFIDKPKEFLPILELIRDSSPTAVVYALEVCKDRDLFVTPDLLKLLIFEPKSRMMETDGWKICEFEVPEPDLLVFDKKIGRELL
ncbi:MAG: IS21 family transposase [Candidatus Cloacimonetes bacterium]|nr:IS21 family transposase [Candidatus Cloacimonadota bacterium]